MLDPDSTNVLQRRVLASLVDLGLIAVATALIWRTQCDPVRRSPPATRSPTR